MVLSTAFRELALHTYKGIMHVSHHKAGKSRVQAQLPPHVPIGEKGGFALASPAVVPKILLIIEIGEEGVHSSNIVEEWGAGRK